MPICYSCGGEIQARAKFCDSCGATMKPDSGTQFQTRRWIIGGASECDLIVDQPKVSSQHCLLTEAPDGFWIEDLHSTNGVYVNGRRITSREKVTRKDVITLGQNVPMPWPAPDAAAFARIVSIGRELDNDVVFDYPMISGHHARILISRGEAVIEDLNSTNGTAVGRIENKVRRSPLSQDDTVYFGSFGVPASRLLSGKPTIGQNTQSILAFKGRTMTLGRDPNCDQVLDYPMVSWRHASLTRDGLTITVEDLGSTNGTFVNGRRITGKTVVNIGDVISLGSYTFQLTAAGTFEKRDYRGNLTIEARNVTVDVPKKRLLEDVSLTIYPSELVGLMGPSGSGKTTLMMALNGYTPPTHGAVRFNGQDLQQNFGQFCGHVGYVPQDDIMHRDLTVGQALYYTARLRLPSDFSDDDIQKRIADVLKQLGLQGLEDVIIGSPEKKGISGGQRKRVNLAMELLTDPSVLFLDEPTSGLSSEDALMVMKMLKRLAGEGKTILITIHQPSLEVFSLMDSLIVISRDAGAKEPGRLVYFGPAYPDSVYFFNPGARDGRPDSSDRPSPDGLLRGLAESGTQEWVKRYEQSTYKREYVEARTGRMPSDSGQSLSPKIQRKVGFDQWWTLVRRCSNIKLKDVGGTAILLAQAPIIAMLTVIAFSGQTNEQSYWKVAGAMYKPIFVLVIAALWFGCSNSAREIIGEWAIYHRERMVNLKIPSYVASKFTVLGALCVIQCAGLLVIVHWGCGLKGPWLAMYGVLLLTALNGVALGLLASALARTSEMAIALVPLLILPMLIAGGAFTPRNEMGRWSWVPQGLQARWAFEATLLLEAENRDQSPESIAAITRAREMGYQQENTPRIDMAHKHFPDFDDPNGSFKKDRSGVMRCVTVLGAMFVLNVIAILAILKLRDVHR